MKFKQYDIVKFEGSIGKWIVLYQDFLIDKNLGITLIDKQYVIKLIERGHSEPQCSVSEDKLESL